MCYFLQMGGIRLFTDWLDTGLYVLFPTDGWRQTFYWLWLDTGLYVLFPTDAWRQTFYWLAGHWTVCVIISYRWVASDLLLTGWTLDCMCYYFLQMGGVRLFTDCGWTLDCMCYYFLQMGGVRLFTDCGWTLDCMLLFPTDGWHQTFYWLAGHWTVCVIYQQMGGIRLFTDCGWTLDCMYYFLKMGGIRVFTDCGWTLNCYVLSTYIWMRSEFLLSVAGHWTVMCYLPTDGWCHLDSYCMWQSEYETR